ncbi:MAG: YCF48-related protein [Planctomycetes bacterium]|nr:YCF48-related protein [Planctomycetota bacterium]
MNKGHWTSIALVLAAALVVSGCGGKSGRGFFGGPSRTVSGPVVAGVVANATVRVYQINPDRTLALLSEGTTSATGVYQLEPAGDGPFLIVASGGTFKDEATGQTRALASPPLLTSLDSPRAGTITAIVGSGGASSGAVPVTLTPLSTFAAERAVAASASDPSALTESAVSQTNMLIAQEFGLSGDPRTITPLDLTDPAQASAIASSPGSDAAKLGAVLAGLSQAAKDLGLSDPMALVDALAADFSDGVFNGQAGGQTITVSGGATLSPTAATSDLAGSTQAFLDDPTVNTSGTTSTSFSQLLDDVQTQQVAPAGVNKAPSFSPIADQPGIIVGSGQQSVAITNVNPGADESTQVVTVTATSTGTGTIAGLSVTGTGATRTLTYQPTGVGSVTVTVRAQDDGGTANGGVDTATRTFTITIVPAPAPSLRMVTQPGNAIAGATFTAEVEYLDPITGQRDATFVGQVTVALASNPGGATLSGTLTVPAVAGVATFADLSLERPGAGYTLTATSSGATAVTTAGFDIAPGPAVALAFFTPPTDVVAGAPISPAFLVELRDVLGNRATTSAASVTIALGANPGGATPSGTLTRPTLGGLATFDDVTLDRVGAGYTFVAGAAGLPNATSAAFDVTPAAPAQLAFVVQPTSATAGATIAPAIEVEVLDALGNRVTGAATPVTIALAANPAGGVLAGTLTRPPVNGVATFDDLSLERAGAGYQLGVSAAGVTGATSAPFTISPAAASQLAFTAQPQNGRAGEPLAPPVVVAIQDAFGNLVASGATIDVALGANPGGASLGGDTSLAAVNGLATFGDLTLDELGVGYTLVASSTGLTDATSGAFSITDQRLVFTVQPSTVVAGEAITPAIVVEVQDGVGAVVPVNDPITLALANDPGGATLGGTLVVNAVNGVATFPGITLDKTGVGYTLAATAPDSAAGLSSAFDVTPGAPARLAIGVQPSAVQAGQPIAPAVTVQVLDANDNLVTGAGDVVSFAIASGPGGAALTGTTAEAATGGVATFADLRLDLAGTYTLEASATGLTAATTQPFGVSPGAPDRLVVVVGPSDVAAGASITPAVVIAVYDAHGNVVPAATDDVTVALQDNPGGSTLLGTLTVPAVNGLASFPDLSLDRVGQGYTLSATAPTLTGATTGAFDVTPGAPAQLSVTVQPSDVTAGEAITPAVQVSVLDAQGNLVPTATPSITAALDANPGAATLGGMTTVSAAAGVATFADLTLDRAAAGYTLRFTSTGLSDGLSGTFQVTPAAPAQLAVTVQPSATTAGEAIVPAIEVTTLDAFGNVAPVDGVLVALAIATNPGGATLTGPTETTTAGVAVFAATSLEKAGVGYTLEATAPGLTAATTDPFDIAPAAPAALVVKVEPSDVPAGSAISPAVVFGVLDAFGNDVTTATDTVTVALGMNPGGAALTGDTEEDAAAGLATFADLRLDVTGTGYTLVGSAPGLTSAETAGFDVTPAAPDRLQLFTGPATQAAGDTFPPIEVRVLDGLGNLVSTANHPITVSLSTNPPGATLLGTLTVPAVNGVASFDDLRIDRAAAGYVLEAETAGLTAAQSAPFDITPAAPAEVVFAVQPASAEAGAPVTPTVRIQDAFGNTCDVTFGATLTIANNPGAATLLGTPTDSGAAGVLAFSVGLDKAGVGYTLFVEATVGAATFNATSDAFDITPAAPDHLEFAVEPSDVVAGAAISPAVQVRILDAFDNAVDAGTVDLALDSNPGPGVLGGTLSQPVVGGVATFADLVLEAAAAGYTLRATTAAVGDPAISATFTVLPGPAAQLSVTPAAPAAAPVGAALQTLVVGLHDAFGNLVPSDGVAVEAAISTNPAGGVLGGTTTRPTAGGLAVFDDLTIDQEGVGYALTFSSGALTDVTTGSFDILGRQLVFLVQPVDTAAGTILTPAIEVQLQDALGNPILSTDDVTIALVGGGALLGTTTVSASNGVAVFDDLQVLTAAQGHQLQATSPGVLVPATSDPFDVTPGPAAALSFTTSPGATAVNAPLAPPPAVAVRDTFGNVVASATDDVTLTIDAGPGQLVGLTTRAAVDGVATFPGLAIDQISPNYVLRAAATGLADALSQPFDVTPPAPVIGDLFPASGALSGRTPTGAPIVVRIEATNLAMPVNVEIDGASLANATLVDGDTAVVGELPPGLRLGPVDVVVRVAGGLPGTKVGGFTYTGAWAPVNSGLAGGHVFRIVPHPSAPLVALASNNEGLYRTDDGGQTFTLLRPGFVEAAAFAASAPDVIYIADNGGVRRSQDGGLTFAPLAGIPGNPQVAVLVVHPTDPDLVYAGTGNLFPGTGVWKTADAGQSWSQASAGLPADATVRALAIDPSNPQVLYAGHTTSQVGMPTTGQGVYKSTDGAQTWARVGPGVGPDELVDLVVDPTDPQVVYAASYGEGAFKSTDGGTTFAPINAGLGASLEVDGLALDPAAPGRLYVVMREGAFKSTDGGATWAASSTGFGDPSNGLGTTPSPTDVAVSADGGRVYAGSFGQGLFVSSDQAAAWGQVLVPFDGLGVTSVVHHPTDPSTVFVGTNGRGVLRTTDGGFSWQPRNTGLADLYLYGMRSLAMDRSNPAVLYAGTERGGLFKTTDAGGSWTQVGAPPIPADAEFNTVATGPGGVVFAAVDDRVFRSTDAGATWTEVTAGLPSSSVSAIVVAHDDPSTVYVAFGPFGGAGVHRSTNGGASWSSLATGPLAPNASVTDLSMHPGNAQVLVVTQSGGLPLRTTDGGATWTELTSFPAGPGAAAVALGFGQRLYVASNQPGVLLSTDGGVTWSNQPGGLPYGARTLAVSPANPEVVYAGFGGFGGRGVWKTASGGADVPVVGLIGISPPSGPESSGGFTVTITGFGFVPGATSVLINGVPLDNVVVVNGGTITAEIPAGGFPTGSYTLTVTGPNGVATLPGAFTSGGPVFQNVHPAAAPVSGQVGPFQQVQVRVQASGLVPPVTVRIGGRPLFNPTLIDGGTAVSGHLPAGAAPGPVDVAITSNGVTQVTPGAFTYLGSWRKAGVGLEGGHVIGVAAHPTDPLFALAANNQGLYRTTDGGATFSFLPGLPGGVAAVVFHPTDPDGLFVLAGGSQLWASQDRGATWTQRGQVGVGIFAGSLAVDPTDADVLYAGTGGSQPGVGVFKSGDGGATWNPASSGLPADATVRALAVDPTNPQVVYAVHGTSGIGAPTTGQGIYKSIDGGGTWTQVRSGPDEVGVLVLDPTNAQVVYAAAYGDGVLKSTNGGSTWSFVNTGLGASLEVEGFALDPSAPQTLYAVMSEGAFKTTNGGASWAPVNAGFTEPSTGLGVPLSGGISLAVGSDGARVYAGTWGHALFRSANAAASWTQVLAPFDGLGVGTILHHPTVNGTVFAGTYGRGVLRSTDGGQTWHPRNGGLGDLFLWGFGALAMDPTSTDVLYAATEGGIFKSTNAGLTWTDVTSAPLPPDEEVDAVAAGPAGTVWAMSDARLFRSADGGATWADVTGTLPPLFLPIIRPHPTDTSTAWLTPGFGVFKTTDGGQTWTSLASGPLPPNANVTGLVVAPGDPSVLYVTTQFHTKPLKSLDGGASWLELSSWPLSPGATALAIDPQDPDHVVVGKDQDVHRTRDGGATWTVSPNAGLPAGPTTVYALAVSPFDPERLYVGFGNFGGRGVYLTDDGGAPLPPLVSVASVSPTSDPQAIGNVAIVLQGSGFVPGALVTLGGNVLPTLFLSPTQLVVETPPSLPAGVYELRLSSPNLPGGSVVLAQFVIGFELQAISPAVGRTSGRNPDNSPTRIALTGQGFQGPPIDVRIAGVSLANVNQQGPDLVTADLVPLPPGLHDVELVTALGTIVRPGAFLVEDAYVVDHANMFGGSARIVTHPTDALVAYAVANGGVFRTTDGGLSWTRLPAPGGLSGLALDPQDPQRLYVTSPGAGNQVFRSTDGGQTWSPSTTGASGPVGAPRVHPTDGQIVLVGSGGFVPGDGVFRSTDGGATWAQASGLPAGATVPAIAFDPSSPGVVYAADATPEVGGATGTGLYRSTDGGATWTHLASTSGFTTIMDVVVDPTGVVYVGGRDGLGVQRSADGGASFTPMHTGLTDLEVNALALDPSAPLTLYAGTDAGGELFRTTDGGATWSQRAIDDPSTGTTTEEFAVSVAVGAGGGQVYFGAFTGLYGSADGGATFALRQHGITSVSVAAVVAHPTAPGTFYAGTRNGVWRTTDGGQTWARRNGGLPRLEIFEAHALVLDRLNPDTLYLALEDAGVWRSTDAGLTWSDVTAPALVGREVVAVGHGGPGVVYASSHDGAIVRTTDGGATWSAALDGPVTGEPVFCLAVHPTDPNTVYAGLDDGHGLWKSTDGGATWSDLSGGSLPAGVSVMGLAIVPTAADTVFVTTDGEGAFRTTDGGASWTKLPLATDFTRDVAVDGSVVVVSHWGGIQVSTDGGATFSAPESPAFSSGPQSVAFQAASGALVGGQGFLTGVVRGNIAPAPPILAVFTVSPSGYPADTGGELTITGVGFFPGGPIWVDVGGEVINQVTVDSPTQIRVTVPPGALPPGFFNVTLSHPNAPLGNLTIQNAYEATAP